MGRRQGDTRTKHKCSCCGDMRRDVEYVSSRIHPLVNGEAASVCDDCVKTCILEKRAGVDHVCASSLTLTTP